MKLIALDLSMLGTLSQSDRYRTQFTGEYTLRTLQYEYGGISIMSVVVCVKSACFSKDGLDAKQSRPYFSDFPWIRFCDAANFY
ncbi:hypothetical protein ARMGADRAFT_1004661 [Armillaria gallica]|uniref:Uncharacterized protein n=1 Tax=Armillaria gallica TaxID=47427 RepID=A0A2H3ED48_ARMGA|nr:hypothetical protein ARMGADRAFT_1004661 [Armillaria gallica]